MGKAVGGLPEAAALTQREAGPCRIGAYLALQRKLRRISLDELEALTHIPRRSLERLEGGAYDDAPDGFARGFVRTVSDAIGLDPDDTVSRMLAEPAVVRTGRRLAPGRLLLVVALVVGAFVAGALAPGVLVFERPAAVAVEPTPRPVRYDAVRALAESLREKPESSRPSP